MSNKTVLKLDYSDTLETEQEFEVQSGWWNAPDQQREKSMIAEYVPVGAFSAMDAGAGSGTMIPWLLAKVDGLVFAVEQCKRAIAYMNQHFQDNKRVVVIEADLRSFFLPVDVVVCKAVLKHFSPESRLRVLHNLFRMAKRRVIFTMGVSDQSEDRNPDARYYDWAEPLSTIKSEIPSGWRLVEVFGNPVEPVFVCDPKGGWS